jgi:O-antigen ligase
MNGMKNKSIKRPSGNANVLWWIFGGSSITTIYFNSKVQDPFNSPKLWLVLLISSWLIGHLVKNKQSVFREIIVKRILIVLTLFIGFTLISAFKTDESYTAFLGENMRRTGALNYISLSILLFAAVAFVRLQNMNRIYGVGLFTGVVVGGYGLLQSYGIDFVRWNNPYNSVISTVGNPNFSAAIMAVLATLIFGPALIAGYNKYFRATCFLISTLLLYTIYQSGARQGLISIALGIGFYITVFIYSKNRLLGSIFLFSGLSVSIFAILGMLQIGPLTSMLYKPSVTVRGYYWRAGIEMLKDHPFFGVGLDRYGAYFKEYREASYPLNYGFDITSTNAHNVPIQIFSTGGIFVGLAYMAILLIIFWRGITAIKKNSGNNRLVIASVFSAWLAFQAQSIISIDNIGITVWGWVLGGTVIGLSIPDSKSNNQNVYGTSRIKPVSLLQPLVSGTFTLIAIVIISFCYKSESNMYMQRMVFNPSVEANKAPLLDYALKTVGSPLVEPTYRLNSATNMIANGFVSDGVKQLEILYKSDPRNLDLLLYLANYEEFKGNIVGAIKFRNEIYKYDPWNSKNLLRIGQNCKKIGDFECMKDSLSKILVFDNVSAESKSAQLELIA